MLSSQPGPRAPCPVLGACPTPIFFLGGDTRRGVAESLGSQQTGEAGECWGIAAVGMGRWPGGAEEGSRSRCRAWLGPGRGRVALESMCPFDPRVLGQETAGTGGSIGSAAFCTHSSLTPVPLGGRVLWSGSRGGGDRVRGASTRQWSRVPVSSFTASDSESYLGNLPCVQVEGELFFPQILCFILYLDSRDPFSICSFYCVRHEPLFPHVDSQMSQHHLLKSSPLI